MPRTMFAILAALLMAAPTMAEATEYHVAVTGSDANPGTRAAPLRTIQRAAELAQPGDVVTVHQGTYRERVNPPRGGTSDAQRIVYQAAPGEKVEIKGSEVVRIWTRVQNDTWQATLPNAFFKGFNPYSDLIHGDWFNPLGRQHHTGAVYLNGEWLVEAAKLEDVLAPAGTVMPPFAQRAGQYLVNVAWLQPADAGRIPAAGFAAKEGTRNAPCSEGGECVGWIEAGHWLRYDRVSFGTRCEEVAIRAAAAGEGGVIELRLDRPDGELLGSVTVPSTGDWQTWASFPAKIKPTSGEKTLVLVFRGPQSQLPFPGLWFARVDDEKTTIWAQFGGVDPNKELVEINARRAVFYPDAPGRNYITVRGFTMGQAATNWAPPTAEQVGLIGTHWSKGWVIENNVISHSTCCGIALGKHGDQYDNTSANSAEGYVKTIERAHAFAIPWTRENIGGHVVRNNVISHCEQTGIVGSLGAAFSTITGNTIHDIHVRRLFTGAEMAGIKLHGAIDVQITGNHITRTCLGLWLDWMAQGTRVSANLFDHNGRDLFVEVDHGPFLVDNNLFLSPATLLTVSQGGAYVHNLMLGSVAMHAYDARQTPFHKPHSTEVAGMHDNPNGDDRYLNNILAGPADLSQYDNARLPVRMDGNAFLKGAKPSRHEAAPLVKAEVDPGIKLVEGADGFYLEGDLGPAMAGGPARKLVTTELLGKASIPDAAYEAPGGSPIRIDTDHLGRPRDPNNPAPGPFERPASRVKVWPRPLTNSGVQGILRQ